MTLGSAVSAIAPVAREQGVAVTLTIDPKLAACHRFDAFRLRQVVLNLLSNAVKFSTSGSSVELAAEWAGDEPDAQLMRIRVVDHGQGIPADQLALLFKPYAQAGHSIAHRSGGTGLGLSLCKRLVDAMGGQIDITSQTGAGSQVTVDLHLPVVLDAPACAAHADNPEAYGQMFRVLLVDDDRVQQILLSALLTQAGCAVDVADDGKEAIALWSRIHHRLIVTDMNMPHMGGLALAEWLRQQPGGAEVRLVGVSADLDDLDRARAAGIDRMLSKPVQQALIDSVVREARLIAAPA
jgi:two-component system capsular synthesis sensor histidine kinase RcsC